MSNRLNFSSIDDAWGIPEDHQNDLNNKFNYQKPKENIMTIDSNEIKKPMKQEFKPVQETYSDYIKPCSLVDEHIKNCDLCRNKLYKSNNHSREEHFTSRKYIEAYNNFDLNESFENISPSQKNLLIVILYGILIILISDLIIKEEKIE
jgi:hypothetical protein